MGIDVSSDFTGKLCSRIPGRVKEETRGGKDRLGVLTFPGPPSAGSDSPGARPSIIKPFASPSRPGSVVVVQADNRPITSPKERATPLGTIGARRFNRLQVLIIDIPGEVLTVKY